MAAAARAKAEADTTVDITVDGESVGLETRQRLDFSNTKTLYSASQTVLSISRLRATRQPPKAGRSSPVPALETQEVPRAWVRTTCGAASRCTAVVTARLNTGGEYGYNWTWENEPAILLDVGKLDTVATVQLGFDANSDR